MSSPDDLREALETSLAENPDDLAAHAAYADLLSEQGDPRGEFISVQMALEDEALPPEERRRLRQRERALLAAHEREWLGELGPLLLGTPEEQRALFVSELADPSLALHEESYPEDALHFSHGWARGWLDSLDCSALTVEMARKLGRAPIAQLLRSLVYRGRFFGYSGGAWLFRYEPGPDFPRARSAGEVLPVEILASYPAIRNLRIFQFGREADPREDHYTDGTKFQELGPLIERMPRLEELYIFGHINSTDMGRADLRRIVSPLTLYNLCVFQHYHGHAYPLEALAGNPALGRLTHLLCFPHDFAGEYDQTTSRFTSTAIGRAGVRAVVTSPYLTALTHLQLRCCDGGDPMIGDIVASGVLKRLKVLDLRHGHVSDEGARRLAGSPELRHLELLDLTNNRLTDAGVAALRATGVRLVSEGQQSPPYDFESILYYGDSE
jgi:uncharacterized protein (TIGR02996 family)